MMQRSPSGLLIAQQRQRQVSLSGAGSDATREGGVTSGHVGALMVDEIKAEVKRIVPPLSEERFKGQAGKVAILGGCKEYTGAPYFCAISALKVGADLSHVFCTKDAACIIKSYNPELIVHPYFMESTDFAPGQLTAEQHRQIVQQATADVESWFTRLDCLVVGPGLGRDPLLLDVACAIMHKARLAGLPLVLDGDGLLLVAREPELVQGYSQCVLTPNLNEFRRLASTMGVSLHGPNNDRIKKLMEVTAHLNGPVLVSKGPVDVICDGKNIVVCNTLAGLRRCGGQGDILAGSIATFVSWTLAFIEVAKHSGEMVLPELNPMVLASFGGCMITRTASSFAFSAKRRAMLAGDMVEQLGNAVELLFDSTASSSSHLSGPLVPEQQRP